MNFETKISRRYKAHRDTLAVVFPAAYRFLGELEALSKRGDFHLGTALNLHLYEGTKFLCYARIDGPFLVLSQLFNGQIKKGTHSDNSPDFLRQVVRRRIEELDGFSRWAKDQATTVRLSTNTPAEFFDGVLADLRARIVRA